MPLNPEFLNFIKPIFDNRQQSISSTDLHNIRNIQTFFYLVSVGIVRDNLLIRHSSPFSDSTSITIFNGGDVKIFNGETIEYYMRRSNPCLDDVQGQRFIHYSIADEQGNQFTFVKMMSPDGLVMLKIINKQNGLQTIHYVCEISWNNYFQLTDLLYGR